MVKTEKDEKPGLMDVLGKLVVALAMICLAAPAAAQPAADRQVNVPIAFSNFETMDRAFALWTTRVVSPHYPEPDPIRLAPIHAVEAITQAANRVGYGTDALAIVSQLAATNIYEGRTATGEKADSQHKLRALFPAYQSGLVFLTLAHGAAPGANNAPPQDVSSLRDREILFWPPPEGDPMKTALAGAALRTLGVPFSAGAVGTTLDIVLGKLRSNRNAALALSDGYPLLTLERFASGNTATFFGFSSTEKTRLTKAIPLLDFVNIPPGGMGYRNPRGDEPAGVRVPLNPATIRTVGMWHFAVVNTDMPVCVAYHIVDTVMKSAERARYGVELLPVLLRQYVNLSAVKPANFEHIQDVPLHAGAALWLRVNHHAVPASPPPDTTAEICS